MQTKGEWYIFCKLSYFINYIKGKYMRKQATLITGANGEMGHGLIAAMHNKNQRNISVE